MRPLDLKSKKKWYVEIENVHKYIHVFVLQATNSPRTKRSSQEILNAQIHCSMVIGVDDFLSKIETIAFRTFSAEVLVESCPKLVPILNHSTISQTKSF